MLSLIVATDNNNAIGNSNELLWHLSADLKYFKSVTSGHPIIMGRKTYESIGRPLPLRDNIVLTRGSIMPPVIKPGSTTTFRVENSLEKLIKEEKEDGREFFVIGGGEIYNQTFPFADRLYITHIKATAPKADTFFPKIDPNIWGITWQSEEIYDEENDLYYEFLRYDRKSPKTSL